MTVFRKVSKVVLPVIATGGILALVLTEIAKEEETEYRETENYLQNSPVNQMVKSIDSIQDEAEKRHIIAQEKEKQRAKEMFARIDAEVARIKEKDRQKEIVRLKAIEEEKKKKQDTLKKQQNINSKNGSKTVDTSNQSGWMTFEATYYSAFCDTCGGNGITASGVSVANSIYYQGMRVIATNKNEIPMYSIVEVKAPYGSFKAVALDTGGFGAGGVDILVDSDKTAYSLGRHNVKIKILGRIK